MGVYRESEDVVMDTHTHTHTKGRVRIRTSEQVHTSFGTGTGTGKRVDVTIGLVVGAELLLTTTETDKRDMNICQGMICRLRVYSHG